MSDPLTQLLQEVRLDILPERECVKMGASMKVDTKKEICAGKQIYRRKDGYFAIPIKDKQFR
jgi:hypothetical protein